MFSCSKCGADFKILKFYLSHIRVKHRHEPFMHHTCGVSGCPNTFRTYNALRMHMYRHKLTNVKTSTKYVCNSCGFKTYLQLRFISHYKDHENIICPLKQCSKIYTKYSSFTSHLARCHSKFKINDVVQHWSLLKSKKTNLVTSETEEIDIDVGNVKNDVDLPAYERNLFLFILRLQEKFLLPMSTIQEIVAGMEDLQIDNLKLAKDAILQSLKEKDLSDHLIFQAISEVSPSNELQNMLKIMKSKYLKEKHMLGIGLINPVEYFLGFESNTRATFQYIPIIANLQSFCKNDEVLEYVMAPRKVNDSNLLADFCDGTIFKKNEAFNQFPVFQIILYYDEFQVSNPLRGNQTKHKIAAFYYTLGNLSVSCRSVVNNIQLAILCKASYLKNFGLSHVLSPLLKDLKVLENEGVPIEGSPGKIKGNIVFVVSDNLGAHQLGGFSQSFSSNVIRCCRFCLATGNEMRNSNFNSFIRRTEEIHNHQISLLNLDPGYGSVYGLKFDSPLNELNNFHTSYMLPPDAMHDFLEGIIPMELGLIIHKLIADQYFNLFYLNHLIASYEYGLHDAANKPIQLGEHYHKGTKMNAARTWCLLRLLPIIIGHKVPENNKAWQLLLLLKDMVDMVFAPVISVTYVTFLQDVIQDHHSLFKELFPDIQLKPKHHFIAHYPDLILEFGPLTCSWAMRFEAKHYYFKRIAHCVKNSINLCYSLAQRHQQLQCYCNFESSRCIDKNMVITSSKFLDTSCYSDDIKSMLEGSGEYFAISKVEVKGISYKRAMCVLVGFEEDDPLMAKIIVILSKDNSVFFLVRVYSCTTMFHIRGYKLEKSLGLKMLTFEDFIDIYPLSIYKYNGKSVVIPKYLLFDKNN